MNILIWHVHGSWTTSFVQGPDRYLVPVEPKRGPDGRGRALTYAWPPNVCEVELDSLAFSEIDAVVLQRPRDLELCAMYLPGRVIGRHIPAVIVEHNAPQGDVNAMRHWSTALDAPIPVVHVTHTNALLWDTGRAPTVVIEHGVVDPGYRYRGNVSRAAAVINEPIRRRRVVGLDLLYRLAKTTAIDVYGIGTDVLPRRRRLVGHGDLVHEQLLNRLAEHRAYVHPYRWTSLGLALIEAMLLGLPVAVVGLLEAALVVPNAAGVVTNRPDVLATELAHLLADEDEAVQRGRVARQVALDRFGIGRFVDDWQHLLKEICA